MEFFYKSLIGNLKISAEELYVDNKSRERSGHMSHAMVEYAPGKVIAFNSNCSARRLSGHSAHGWIEYRYSEDGGKNWSEIHEMPYSKEVLLEGVFTISIEKAVFQDGVLTCFAVRNSQYTEICCEPWDTPLVIQSYDLGKTWEKPVEFSSYRGRIYDAKIKDSVIYALETCDKDFLSEIKEPRYRLFTSHDNGKSFQEKSIVDFDSYKRGYGALQFRPDGVLLAYACNIEYGYSLEVSLSRDNGETWEKQQPISLKYGMRNVQIAPLEKGYVMHGRAWINEGGCGKGQVIYTSVDGLNWDDGILLETEKKVCYYSNMLPLKDENGKEYVLLQYSDLFSESAQVNVMHRFLSIE